MNGSSNHTASMVLVDADNTLWDTNQIYADAQLALLADVEEAVGERATVDDRLAWLRKIDQGLAERHHARLRYPPRLLAKAVALALKGMDIATATRFAWSGGRSEAQLEDTTAMQIERAFFENVKETPKLRKGVAAGLERLHDAGCSVLILTEGGRDKVLTLLREYELAAYVSGVIEARKEPRMFERVVAAQGKRTRAYMIGDQLDRDIIPAKAAGLTTIFFPGGFQPKWQATESVAAPDWKVSNFEEAAAFILEAQESTAQQPHNPQHG